MYIQRGLVSSCRSYHGHGVADRRIVACADVDMSSLSLARSVGYVHFSVPLPILCFVSMDQKRTRILHGKHTLEASRNGICNVTPSLSSTRIFNVGQTRASPGFSLTKGLASVNVGGKNVCCRIALSIQCISIRPAYRYAYVPLPIRPWPIPNHTSTNRQINAPLWG